MGDLLDLFSDSEDPKEATEEPLRARLTASEPLPVDLPWPDPEDVPAALRGWKVRERLGRRIYLHKPSNAWVSEETALAFKDRPPTYRPRYFYRLCYLGLPEEYVPDYSTLAPE